MISVCLINAYLFFAGGICHFLAVCIGNVESNSFVRSGINDKRSVPVFPVGRRRKVEETVEINEKVPTHTHPNISDKSILYKHQLIYEFGNSYTIT